MKRVSRVRVVSLAALVLVGVAMSVLVTGGDHQRMLTAVLREANYIAPGAKVVIGGSKVGRVTAVEVTPDGQARLTMAITDSRAWPLPQATQLRVRWLGTIAFAGRYIQLRPPRSGPPIPDGGEVATTSASEPVEFDSVFDTFDAKTRGDLRSTLRTAGAAFRQAGPPLSRALGVTPPAVHGARAVVDDLTAHPDSLDTLVRATDRILAGVQRSDPDLGQLIVAADRTFRVTAERHRELGAALAEAPSTLGMARRTLARADGTLQLAGKLTSQVSGGERELRRLAPPLQRLLRTVQAVGPDATRTLRELRRAAPDLNPFLARARVLVPRVRSVAREAAKQLNCVRPYAPEVAGLASTWAGFQTRGDKVDKYARIDTPALPFDVLPTSTAQAAKLFPSLRYAFPRPPGEVAGQPWLIPECGVGPDSLDPSKDPEAP